MRCAAAIDTNYARGITATRGTSCVLRKRGDRARRATNSIVCISECSGKEVPPMPSSPAHPRMYMSVEKREQVERRLDELLEHEVTSES